MCVQRVCEECLAYKVNLSSSSLLNSEYFYNETRTEVQTLGVVAQATRGGRVDVDSKESTLLTICRQQHYRMPYDNKQHLSCMLSSGMLHVKSLQAACKAHEKPYKLLTQQ